MIIKLIDKKHDRDTHDNASRLVIEVLRVSRDGQYAQAADRCEDPLLNTLESGETVELLLKIIFGRNDVSFKGLPDICYPNFLNGKCLVSQEISVYSILIKKYVFLG